MLEERSLYNSLINDWSLLPEFLEYFDKEAKDAKDGELILSGRIESLSKNVPVIMDKRFTQLQILNATIEYFEIQLEKERSKHYKKYLENYQKSLTSRDVEKYVNGEGDVVSIALIINELSLMRNIFVSITKSIDAKSFQIHNITKLRSVGLEDSTID